MSEAVYFDFGRPDVEMLARAICVEYGGSPDALVPETGYANARMVPAWWKHQDKALAFLAMTKATKLIHSE